MGDAVDVILPSGGRIKDESFARDAGTQIKALSRPGGGDTILARTVAALRATGRAGRVVAVGPERELREEKLADVEVVGEGDTGPENIFRGLERLRASGGDAVRRVLVVTTDLPFVTGDALRFFLDACPASAEVCVPVVRREHYEARFPGSTNEYVVLGDGAWTLGGAFLLDPDALARNRARIDQVFEARKSQIAMARLLGPVFIARFLTKRLTVADIERRCSDLLGCAGVAVRDAPPELAYDIDRPEHLRYARAQSS